MELQELLQQDGDDLIAEAWVEVRQAHLEHYYKEETTRDRLGTLLTLTEQCITTGRADPIVAYINQIARERWSAGFDLFEVQTSINIFEEAIWKRILGRMEPDQVPHALGLISTVLGMAKDSLARTYVTLASSTPPASVLSRGESG